MWVGSIRRCPLAQLCQFRNEPAFSRRVLGFIALIQAAEVLHDRDVRDRPGVALDALEIPLNL